MWQGKPVRGWKEAQAIKFFYLLTGEEFIWHCTNAEKFFMVKSFMEKELPEVWACYHWWCLKERLPEFLSGETYNDMEIVLLGDLIQMNKRFLDLTNLIIFLLDNQGWAWKECDCEKFNGIKKGQPLTHCHNCNGTGKVKHPALIYSESLKEGPCEKR